MANRTTIMSDTPTPRTDKVNRGANHHDHFDYVDMRAHAQQLERELAEVTKQRDALADACSAIEHAYLGGSDSEWGNALMDIRQALAATKGGSHE